MSTSAVYSPHPPTPNPLPTTTPDSASSVTKSGFARGCSAGATPNGSSVSPSRPVAASGPVSTRSRRSQTSKEPSPEKMSASEVLVPNDDSVELPVLEEISKVSTTTRTVQDDEQQQVETTEQESDNHSAPIASIPATVEPTNPTVTPPPPKSQKIMLVIGRKRKADDEVTTVSSELHTPPSHASKTPEVDPSLSAVLPKPTVPAPATTGAKQPNDAALNEPSDSTKGSNLASAPAINTAQENEPPKRAPRKRRKWLRKGEVDPDDPKAVAEQRARHALIDAALEALDQQEQMLIDNTHPQLLALWDEVERRRDIQLAYNKYHEECEIRELDRLYLQELGQIRCQFRQDCEDLAALMTFENRRVVSRLDAERVYHDRGKPFTKRMYTNMPTLKEGRGSGGWTVPTKRLLSKGTRRKTLVRVGDHVRQRADVSLTPRMASMKEAQSDLIRLGLREAPPESSSEEEEEQEESEEEDIEQPEPEPEPEPEVVEPLPPLPPPPKSVQPRARAPSPSPPVIPPVKAAPVPRKSRRAPPAPTPILHPVELVELEPRNEPIPFSHPPPPPHAPLRRMDILDPYSRDRPPSLDPRPPPSLDPRDRPPPPPIGDLRDPRPPPLVDPRDRPPPPLNDPRDRPPPPPLGADPRDRMPPHPYDRAGPPYDRPYPHPPPMDPHGRPPPLASASRPPPRYDDRGDWWGPRDRHVGPGPGGYIPPPMPQTATAPLSAHPPPQPQTATPAGYWARPPPNDEWGDYHYYDRRGYPGGGPPPPAFAGSRP